MNKEKTVSLDGVEFTLYTHRHQNVTLAGALAVDIKDKSRWYYSGLHKLEQNDFTIEEINEFIGRFQTEND